MRSLLLARTTAARCMAIEKVGGLLTDRQLISNGSPHVVYRISRNQIEFMSLPKDIVSATQV